MQNNTRRKACALGMLVAFLVAFAAWIAFAYARATVPVEGAPATPSQVQSIQAFGSGSPHVIPAAAFTADGYDPASQFHSFGGGYLTGNTQAYGCVVAPIYLPNDAVILSVFASIYDNDATKGVNINVRRVNNFSGTNDTIATLNSSSEFAGIQVLNDTSIDNPEVIYPEYAYYATVCLSSASVRLYSLRLYYVDSFIFLPLVLNDY